MSADDVASALAVFATSPAANGTVEIGGPERFRLYELVRQGLAATNDPREVVADPNARYYGVALAEKTLVPADDAQLGKTRFADWLKNSALRAHA